MISQAPSIPIHYDISLLKTIDFFPRHPQFNNPLRLDYDSRRFFLLRSILNSFSNWPDLTRLATMTMNISFMHSTGFYGIGHWDLFQTEWRPSLKNKVMRRNLYVRIHRNGEFLFMLWSSHRGYGTMSQESGNEMCILLLLLYLLYNRSW